MDTIRIALTQAPISGTQRNVGRKKEFTESLRVPLVKGTTERIDALLSNGEPRLDLIREGIEREIKRRQASRLKTQKRDST